MILFRGKEANWTIYFIRQQGKVQEGGEELAGFWYFCARNRGRQMHGILKKHAVYLGLAVRCKITHIRKLFMASFHFMFCCFMCQEALEERVARFPVSYSGQPDLHSMQKCLLPKLLWIFPFDAHQAHQLLHCFPTSMFHPWHHLHGHPLG